MVNCSPCKKHLKAWLSSLVHWEAVPDSWRGPPLDFWGSSICIGNNHQWQYPAFCYILSFLLVGAFKDVPLFHACLTGATISEPCPNAAKDLFEGRRTRLQGDHHPMNMFSTKSSNLGCPKETWLRPILWISCELMPPTVDLFLLPPHPGSSHVEKKWIASPYLHGYGVLEESFWSLRLVSQIPKETKLRPAKMAELPS